MQIGYFLQAFVILGGILLGIRDSKKNRGIFILLCSAMFLFVGSMRSPEWFTSMYGIDTYSYHLLFEQVFDMDWQEFMTRAAYRYLTGQGEDDIGFLGLRWIISFVTHDFAIYSLIIELLFFVPFGLLLYRYSTAMRQVIFAYMFYYALVHVFILAGGRQMFALGVDVLAVMSMMEDHKWRSLVLLFIGMTFHLSSALVAIPIILIWLDVKPWSLKMLHILSFILFPIVYLYPNEIIRFMGNSIGMEKYADFGKGAIAGGANSFIILLGLLSLIIFVAIRSKQLSTNKVIKSLYVMAPLFTFFGPLINSNGSMIRITLYLYIYIVLLFPFSMDILFKDKERNMAYIIAIGALAFLSGGGLEYYFYWQR